MLQQLLFFDNQSVDDHLIRLVPGCSVGRDSYQPFQVIDTSPRFRPAALVPRSFGEQETVSAGKFTFGFQLLHTGQIAFPTPTRPVLGSGCVVAYPDRTRFRGYFRVGGYSGVMFKSE